MNEFDMENVLTQTDGLRSWVSQAAQELYDFGRRLELILNQDHKKITVRDASFSTDFGAFCTRLRQEIDKHLDYWQQARASLRSMRTQDDYTSSLAGKSFGMKAKALSRSSDEFTTAYDYFCRFYKNYTLSKLPVWLLTSCCDDLNNLTGKILFLAREMAKKTGGKGEMI